MDIYENIIIGNFLFGLGASMGIRHNHAPVDQISINLLQQTPFDPYLGDVMVTSARIYRLIEFKRLENDSIKELSKRDVIDDALKAKGMGKLNDISRRIHWYIESRFHSKPRNRTQVEMVEVENQVRVFPYLDFTRPQEAINLTDFIEKTARDATYSEMDEDELNTSREYVKFISGLYHGSKAGSGALLIVVTGSGALRYVAVNNIRDLFLKPEIVREQYLRLDRTRQMEQERGQEIAAEQSKSITRGMSRDDGMSFDSTGHDYRS
jgi:hypothetical protein